MADYGVVPTGFNRKPLSRILQDIEASLVTEFGPDVIQSPQSPLGQINGLIANFVTQLWEMAEDVYQSYDVDQAEQTRLDILAKLRLLNRAEEESDEDFRRAITNQGFARIDVQDIFRAVRGIRGTTYVQVFVNDTQEMNENLLPPGSICVAVLGGSEDEIVSVLRRYIAPGISTYGNVYVSSNVDGFCRSLAILRPILVPVKLRIRVRSTRDNFGCPPPAPLAIRDQLISDLDYLTGEKRLVNGDDITYFRLRSAIESRFPNVEVVSFYGERDEIEYNENEAIDISFIELAQILPENVEVDDITNETAIDE